MVSLLLDLVTTFKLSLHMLMILLLMSPRTTNYHQNSQQSASCTMDNSEGKKLGQNQFLKFATNIVVCDQHR